MRGRSTALGLVLLSIVVLHARTAIGAGTPLTVASYRAHANAICAADARQENALPHGLTLAEALAASLKIADSAYAKLARLQPPSKLLSLHEQVLRVIKSGLAHVSALLVEAKAGRLTVTEFERDPGMNTFDRRETALWRRIGASVCAK